MVSGLIGNVLVGFGASILWVTHGKYLSDIIQSHREKAGLYTSLFFMMFFLNQIIANFYNTLCLSIFEETSTLIALSVFVSLISQLIFNFLPDAPINDKREKPKKPGDIFKGLLSLFGDRRILSMYGLFAACSCANGIPQSLLVVFYSKMLKGFEIQDQLRISSQIMMMVGTGGIIGGLVVA